MSLQQDMSLRDYIAIIRRRFLLVFIVAVLIFVGAVVFAFNQKHVYEAAGTVLLESPQVKADLLGSADQMLANERIEILKQLVMTRDNLLEIIRKYHLYAIDEPGIKESDALLKFRKSIDIDLVEAKAGQWDPKTAIAFNVMFSYGDAETTRDVTQEIINLFLVTNEKSQKERASTTAEFFTAEAERQRVELERIEKEITAYKQRNAGSLPQDTQIQSANILRIEADIRDNRRDYIATQSEVRNLTSELEAAKAGFGAGGVQVVDNTSISELDKLKQDQARLKTIYSDNHPELRNIQRRIETLEKSAEANAVKQKQETARSVLVANVQSRLHAAEARLDALNRDEVSLRNKLAQLEGMMYRTSQTEGALNAMMRDYDNAKKRYEELSAKSVEARMTDSLEKENKGDRFVLLEKPVLPDYPTKPNRLLIVLAGFFMSIGGGIGSAIFMETIDKRLRGTENLAAALQMRPLAVIPYIQTQSEVKKQKMMMTFFLLAGLVVLIGGLIAIHTWVMPLNDAVSKIADRIL